MRLFLGIIVFVIWASLGRYAYVCEIKQLCNPPEPPIEDIRAKTLDLILDDSIAYLKNQDQFLFKNGLIEPELNDNNKAYLDSLASIVKNDSAIFVTITGFYRPSEVGKRSGNWENLGLARAEELRKLLLQRGITEEKTSLDYKAGTDENLIQPIGFRVYSDRGGTPEEYAKVSYTFTNMTFSDANFEKGKADFKPGDALILYADSVKTYLELNPDKILTIIGHCDEDGTETLNMKLGADRAENAKAYFVDLGVSSTIKTISKGETEPVAPNDIELNKQKNRRVNFVIE